MAAARHRLGRDADRVPVVGRRVAAVLRRRARSLPASYAAARLAPLLLHASFSAPGLAGEAPGVLGLRWRRGWLGALARAGLPPPTRAQRDAPLVDAVIALPSAAALDLLVLVPPGLAPADVRRVEERVAVVRSWLARGGLAGGVTVQGAAELAADGDTARRAIAFGALLAGRLRGAAWDALAEAAGAPPGSLGCAALAGRAPSPLAALALVLAAGADPAGPLHAMLRLLDGGRTARDLVPADAFCLHWTAESFAGGPLEEALRAAGDGGAGAREVLTAGRRVAVAAARAARRVRAAGGNGAEALRAAGLGAGVPGVLLPHLGARLAAALPRGPLAPLTPVLRGNAWEVRLADGAVLGSGASAAQARVRALALAISALASARRVAPEEALPAIGRLDGAWSAVMRRLARPAPGAALLLALEASPAEGSEAPYDLLNRGRARTLQATGALAVWITPGRRPRARRLGAVDALRLLLASADRNVEILAATPEAAPLAARVAPLAPLARAAGDAPFATEAGGTVLLRGERLRSFPAERFALRPRAVRADPEAPDLLPAGRGARGARSALIRCRVAAGRDGTALLLGDDRGVQLRVPAEEDELHALLDDVREILRAARPAAALALELADLSAARAPSAPRRIAVAVTGERRALTLELRGERFGAGTTLGWRDAALAVLAHAPPGVVPRVQVRDVRVTDRGAALPAIEAVWVASAVRRRLGAWIEVELAAYRGAAARR